RATTSGRDWSADVWPSDLIAGSAPNLAQTSATGNFSTAFTSVTGADNATIAYALSITGGNGTASGLLDSHTGLSDVLVLNGNTRSEERRVGRGRRAQS